MTAFHVSSAAAAAWPAVESADYQGPAADLALRQPAPRHGRKLAAAAHVLAALAVALVAGDLAFRTWHPWDSATAFELALLSVAAYAASAFLTNRLARFPRHGELAAVALGSAIAYAALAALFEVCRSSEWTFLAASGAGSFVCRLAVLGTRAQRPLRLAHLSGLRTPGTLRPVPNATVAPLGRRPLSEMDAVLVDGSAPLHPRWAAFLEGCERAGVPIYDDTPAIEQLTGRIDPRWLARGALPVTISRWALFKYAADALLVIGTVPLWGPLALATALAVRLDSPGPIFFWQERVGAGGRAFRMLKFRSMRSDSELQGPRFASRQDDRITRVGRIIRKLRLDELPQFWNVLRGQMSLIGPRPEQAAFVRRFEKELPGYAQRHLLKPGITGWAQVSHGYAADADETRVKLEFDLYYVKNCSPWLDLLIVVKTLATMLTGFGAR